MKTILTIEQKTRILAGIEKDMTIALAAWMPAILGLTTGFEQGGYTGKGTGKEPPLLYLPYRFESATGIEG